MDNLLADFGPLGRAYDEVDWDASPLGPIWTWSETLLGVVDLMLHTRFPVTLFWGPEFALVYNEAYVELIGDKHPAALGRPASEVFPEAWDIIGPMMRAATQRATWVQDEYVPLHRRGFLEECYFTFSYSPVRGRDGHVEGVMDIATETTGQVISRRRIQLLGRLTEALADVGTLEDVPASALPLLREAVHDFPAVDIRLPGVDGEYDARLPRRPTRLPGGESEAVETVPGGQVAWLPLAPPGSSEPSDLVVRLSPLLAPDEEYLKFLRLAAAALRQGLDRVRARIAERRTADAQRTMAEAFQRSLLRPPVRPRRPQVAVRYQPAAELAQVGGDWYDMFELPDRSLAAVIGDVAGHDQHSAAAMAQVRNMLRGVAYTMHPQPPSRVLQGLDRSMLGTTPDIVATALLAHVTDAGPQTLKLTWSNAGHPPPVVIEPDGSTRLLETPPDPLLGVDPATHRADTCLTLAHGTTVVLYTDGLIERRGVPLADGLAWLQDVLRHRQRMEVEDLCDHLLRSVVAVEDDIALLVLRA